MLWSRNSGVQGAVVKELRGFSGPMVQGIRDFTRFRGVYVQEFRGVEVQKFYDQEIQGYSASGVHGLRGL